MVFEEGPEGKTGSCSQCNEYGRKMSELLKVLGNPGKCGSESKPGCGAMIIWVTSKNNRPMPLNPDGVPHWANCPQAREHRRKNAIQSQDRKTYGRR